MTRFVLTTGMDNVLAPAGTNGIIADGDTLSAGDIIAAAPDSRAALILQDGNRFDLSAPSVLLGIHAVYDRSFGDSVITLRDGLDLTVHLGGDSATVHGADNADTIIGGQGFDTVYLASAQERFLAGSAGARVYLDARNAGARIDGGGVTTLTLTGRYGDAVALGRELQGITELDLTTPGLRVALRGAGIATVAVSASHLALSLDHGTTLVTDFAGGNLIRFSGPGQTLVLPYSSLIPGLPADHVLGFGSGDTIDIDLPFISGEALSYDPATGLTTVSETYGSAQTLYLPTGLTGLTLDADPGLPNGDRGTLLRLGQVGPAAPAGGSEAPCFAAGTQVLGTAGWTAVEALREGQRLVTADGRRRVLRWIGHRVVDCARHPRPELVWPVRVLAGAFADAVPETDVVLSPDHAVWVEGMLVPIKYLVNGATIRQEQVAQVSYFHLELASHDLLLASGLPVESYLDTGNRSQFANGGGVISLHADFAGNPHRPQALAPLTTQSPMLRGVRAVLLRRADDQGYRMTQDAGLCVLADGQRIWGRMADGIWSGWVPPRPRELAVVSRAAAPADCDPLSEDLRRLGVALQGVTLRCGAAARRLGPDSPGWGPGFYPAEADAHARWRWTSGHARLDPALWAGLDGPLRLDLHVFRTICYRADDPPPFYPRLSTASPVSSAWTAPAP